MASALALCFAAPANPDPRELIVHRARAPLGVASAAEDARFAARLDALSLVPLRRLDDGLPMLRAARVTASGPFDLDPTRFVLVVAPDSAAAVAARAALML